jgi:hypothetical protein
MDNPEAVGAVEMLLGRATDSEGALILFRSARKDELTFHDAKDKVKRLKKVRSANGKSRQARYIGNSAMKHSPKKTHRNSRNPFCIITS